MATTTQSRSKNRSKSNHKTEAPKVEATRERFIARMAARLRAGWARTRAFGHWVKSRTFSGGSAAGRFVTSAGRKTGRGFKAGGATAWRWSRVGARAGALGISWALLFVARALYLVVHWGLRLAVVLIAVAFVALVAVATLALGIVGLVLWLVVEACYLAIKLVGLVAMVLATPFIAMRSREALREDWQLTLVGLKPKNWHVFDPTALAAQILRDRAAKAERRVADEPAASDGQPHRRPPSKGAATPRRRPRRGSTVGPRVATAAAQG